MKISNLYIEPSFYKLFLIQTKKFLTAVAIGSAEKRFRPKNIRFRGGGLGGKTAKRQFGASTGRDD